MFLPPWSGRRHRVKHRVCQWTLFSSSTFQVYKSSSFSPTVWFICSEKKTFLTLHRIGQFSVLAHPGHPGPTAVTSSSPPALSILVPVGSWVSVGPGVLSATGSQRPTSCCVLSSIAPYWLSWWKAVLHLLVCSRNTVIFMQKILKSFQWSKPNGLRCFPGWASLAVSIASQSSLHMAGELCSCP